MISIKKKKRETHTHIIIIKESKLCIFSSFFYNTTSMVFVLDDTVLHNSKPTLCVCRTRHSHRLSLVEVILVFGWWFGWILGC